jgi:hypothetical protein
MCGCRTRAVLDQDDLLAGLYTWEAKRDEAE